MTDRDILTKIPSGSDQRVHYGAHLHAQNFVDFRFPRGTGPFPVLLVIHGGFWSSAYDLAHMGHLCAAFASKGVITCNLEYRRIGDLEGGWPGTFQDVATGTDYVFERMSADPRFDPDRTAALGFSAGGHLALWLSSRHRLDVRSPLFSRPKGFFRGIVSLAGVADLRAAWKLHLGDGAVGRLMGGKPEEAPERYDAG